MAMSKFTVKTALKKNKVYYAIGSEVEMDAAEAKQLIADGVLIDASSADAKLLGAQLAADAKKLEAKPEEKPKAK